ncbi:nitronate monooxygenase, partial [Burkholderia stabilis]
MTSAASVAGHDTRVASGAPLPSRLPLIQAPMVGSFSPLAIAVCEAGGLGSLACAALGPQQLRDEIAAIRARTPAPFNVNFFCHTPPAPD